MTFEGQYLTYAEYQSLGGSAIGEMPFNLLEFEARNQIDLRTHNRLVNETTIPQKVKICDFHLIEKIKGYIDATNSIGGNIASENTDGYLVSYITADKIKDLIVSKNAELEDIIMSDLYGVVVNNEHIIYNGGV
jgi:hypothetical protein